MNESGNLSNIKENEGNKNEKKKKKTKKKKNKNNDENNNNGQGDNNIQKIKVWINYRIKLIIRPM